MNIQNLPKDIISLIIYNLCISDQLRFTIASKFMSINYEVYVEERSRMNLNFMKYEKSDRIQIYPKEIDCYNLDNLNNASKQKSVITLLKNVKFNENKKYYLNKCVVNDTFFTGYSQPNKLYINNLELRDVKNFTYTSLLDKVKELQFCKCHKLFLDTDSLVSLTKVTLSNCSEITFIGLPDKINVAIQNSREIIITKTTDFDVATIFDSEFITILDNPIINYLEINKSQNIIFDEIKGLEYLILSSSTDITIKKMTNTQNTIMKINNLVKVNFENENFIIKTLMCEEPNKDILKYPKATNYKFARIVADEDIGNIENYECEEITVSAAKFKAFQDFYDTYKDHLHNCKNINIVLEINNKNMRYISNFHNPNMNLKIDDHMDNICYVNIDNCVLNRLQIKCDKILNSAAKILLSKSTITDLIISNNRSGLIIFNNCKITSFTTNTLNYFEQNNTPIEQLTYYIYDDTDEYILPIANEIIVIGKTIDDTYKLKIKNCQKLICTQSYIHINYLPEIVILSNSEYSQVYYSNDIRVRSELDYYLYKTTDSTQIYLRRNKLVSKIFNFGKKLNEVKKDFDKMVDNMTPKTKQKPISYRRSSDGNILCD